MTYAKPTIEVVGNAQTLVLGTKLEVYTTDSSEICSQFAYEADE